MVEIIGLLVIGALIWVLAWAMGAEPSKAERKRGDSAAQQLPGSQASERPIRHAA